MVCTNQYSSANLATCKAEGKNISSSTWPSHLHLILHSSELCPNDSGTFPPFHLSIKSIHFLICHAGLNARQQMKSSNLIIPIAIHCHQNLYNWLNLVWNVTSTLRLQAQGQKMRSQDSTIRTDTQEIWGGILFSFKVISFDCSTFVQFLETA